MLKDMVLVLLLALCIVWATCPGVLAIDSNSIVAAWLLDEGGGDTVVDASGNGHDGTIMGNVGWTDGKLEKGLEFPGIGGSRVEVPHDDSLTLAEWTITAWAKLPGPGGAWAIIVVKDPGDGLQNYALDLSPDGRVFSEVTSGGSWSDCGSTTIVYDDIWHFLAASYDGTTLRVYVDGVKENEQDFAAGDVNTAPVAIGDRMNSAQPLLGVVDDIGLFSVALGEDDLNTIMELGLGHALGITAVEPSSKLTTTWGQLRQ